MENNPISGYSEEMALQQLSPASFLLAAADAAASLHWLTLYTGTDFITWQILTPAGIPAELVQLNMRTDTALLQISPANEYYWNEEQLRHIADAFKGRIALNIPDHIRSERSRNPVHRERYGALVPSRTYRTTPWLVYSMGFIFLLMALAGVHPFNPDARSLFTWGGNMRTAVLQGQWWRLITYMFLHAGAMHLLMNTFALLYIGMYLEPVIGKVRTLAAYVLTGIIAGVLSIIMHPFSVGVGASGAIFGLYGVFFSLLTTGYFQKTAKKTMMRSLLFFIVFNLLTGMQGNTDNAAHIGGLLSGVALGYAYYPAIKDRPSGA